MDFWVVVAAAGAGCLAKRLRSSSINNDGLSKLSYEVSSSGDQELHKYHTRRLERRKKLEKDASENRGNTLYEEIFDVSSPNCGSAADWVSPSRLDDQARARDLQDYSASSAAFVPADFSSEQTETDDDYRNRIGSNDCNSLEESSAVPLGGEMATFHGYVKHGRSLRSRYLGRQFLKPQSSLESCLMAQLYNHHSEMGNFSLNPLTPPTSLNIRPLLVTDGSSIISRFTDPSIQQSRAEVKKTPKPVYSERGRDVLGVPLLPKVGFSKMTKQMHSRTGKERSLGSSSRMITGKKIHSRSGTLLSLAPSIAKFV